MDGRTVRACSPGRGESQDSSVNHIALLRKALDEGHSSALRCLSKIDQQLAALREENERHCSSMGQALVSLDNESVTLPGECFTGVVPYGDKSTSLHIRGSGGWEVNSCGASTFLAPPTASVHMKVVEPPPGCSPALTADHKHRADSVFSGYLERVSDNERKSKFKDVVKALAAEKRTVAAASVRHQSMMSSLPSPLARLWDHSHQHPRINKRAVFTDAEAMKQRLRDAIWTPEYNVRELYHDAGVCQRIARSDWFENFTLMVIASNALWIAIDIDFNDATLLTQAHPVFQVAEHAYCCFFTFEWIVRFGAFKSKRDAIHDFWIVFDSMMLAMMLIETWLITGLVLILFKGDVVGVADVSILRLMRMLRLMRVARVAKLLRNLPELVVLVKGIGVASRGVATTLVILAVLIYVFAIAFVQLTRGTEMEGKFFSSVPRAMSFLLLAGTAPDLIHTVEGDLGRQNLLLAALFFLFILMATYTVLNMLIGVLVQEIGCISLIEKEAMDVTYVRQEFEHLVQARSFSLSHLNRLDVEKIMEDPECLKVLQYIGVDILGMVDLIDFIFKEGNEMSLPDLMDWVLQLRSNNKATVRDIVDMRKLLVQKMSDLEHSLVSAFLEVTGHDPKLLDTMHESTHLEACLETVAEFGNRSRTLG